MRKAVIRNLSPVPEILHVAGIAAPFSIPSDSLAFAPSASDTLAIAFAGSEAGSYSVRLSLNDNCGDTYTLAESVSVIAPRITLMPPRDTSVCPLTPVAIPFFVTNNDSVPRAVTLNAPCMLSQTGLTIPPGATDTLFATLSLPAPGTDTCIIGVTDECGTRRTIPVVATAHKSLAFNLFLEQGDGAPALGGGVTIYVIAVPASGVDSIFTFTITHDPAVLQFDSVHTPCTAGIQQNLDDDDYPCRLPDE